MAPQRMCDLDLLVPPSPNSSSFTPFLGIRALRPNRDFSFGKPGSSTGLISLALTVTPHGPSWHPLSGKRTLRFLFCPQFDRVRVALAIPPPSFNISFYLVSSRPLPPVVVSFCPLESARARRFCLRPPPPFAPVSRQIRSGSTSSVSFIPLLDLRPFPPSEFNCRSPWKFAEVRPRFF